MNTKLLVARDLQTRIGEIKKLLLSHGFKNPHPDLLYFTQEEKLGIEQAKKIKEFFSFKPNLAKGRAVILEDASKLTPDAQNALLKILEEPPPNALIILNVDSIDSLLPTIVSRCEIVLFDESSMISHKNIFIKDIEKLLSSDTKDRFEYIEKLEKKKEFLFACVIYFREKMHDDIFFVDFTKKLLEAEEWQIHNVNLRAILEYLMLVMPKDEKS